MHGVMSHLLSASAQRHGAATVAFPGDCLLTLVEIDRLAGQFAGGLRGHGVGKGDHVLLHLQNCWQWIVAYHAVARLGGVVIPANILNSAEEVSFMVENGNAKAVIAAADRVDRIRRPPICVAVGRNASALSFDDLIGGEYCPSVAVGPDDLFSICYTSGTTGKPKGAMLTHGNLFASVSMTATIHVRHAHDRVYSALPFPHVYGNAVLSSCLLTGASLVAAPRFDAGAALAAIAGERITLFEGVPTMYYQMLAHPDFGTSDFSSLTRCTVGGQTIPLAMLEAIVRTFGCPALELWGMTEVGGPATTHSPWWPERYGSIGLPFPGNEARIADLEDLARDAPHGERGELLVRGPVVMRGYWNDPQATAEAIDSDGWLATGDIAMRDADGYIFIVDRKKDMILTAGYNIYPAELEQVIALYPGVVMVAVSGAPDDEKGEVPQAYIVMAPGSQADAQSLLAHCREHLAAYKVPRKIVFCDDLPKTSTGKIMRRELADAITERRAK